MQKNINTKKESYENVFFKDWYPDIDYEMLPVTSVQNDLCEPPKHLFIHQLSSFDMGNIFKKAKQFKLIKKSEFGEKQHHVLHIYSEENESNAPHTPNYERTILLPVNKIIACKKNKKYTEFVLTEGQVLKTAIKFKKIKKHLLKNGFKELEESHLVIDKPTTHFP